MPVMKSYECDACYSLSLSCNGVYNFVEIISEVSGKGKRMRTIFGVGIDTIAFESKIFFTIEMCIHYFCYLPLQITDYFAKYSVQNLKCMVKNVLIICNPSVAIS